MNRLIDRWPVVQLLTGIVLLSFSAVGCSNTSIPTASTTSSAKPTATDGSVATAKLEADMPSKQQTESPDGKKVGVLLVSHGSHSEQWRTMLLGIEDKVRDEILSGGNISGIKSSFMEYTEPSIATRLKEFDSEGYTNVLIVPILLTVSSHSFDDIPVIAGQKEDHHTLETLKLEGTVIYKPKAKVTMAPLLDFPDVLEKNVARRVKAQSTDPQNEGIVLVAYGSEPYDEEWKELLTGVGNKVRELTGIDATEYCWCGHIARYKSEPTEIAIKKILETKDSAIVIPVLVAVDEMFQGKIIGGAVNNVDQKDHIRYRHDAILPDQNINNWVVSISKKLAAGLADVPDVSVSNE